MMKHIAVIGGGISGLTACYRLAANLRGRKDYTIYLITGLEDRQGGWLRSHRTVPDGFLFERAARSINCKPSNAHAFVQLVRELKLEEEIVAVPKSSPVARNRLIFHDGHIRLASSMPALAKSVPLALLNDILGGFRPLRFNSDDDPSVNEFSSRQFHPTVGQLAMGAFIHGVYGGDPAQWSVKSLFPRMWDLEQRYGSVAIGTLIERLTGRSSAPAANENSSLFERLVNQSTAITFRDGLRTLPSAILSHLTSQQYTENVVVKPLVCKLIDFDDAKQQVRLQLSNGEELAVDRAIAAIPSFRLVNCLKTTVQSQQQQQRTTELERSLQSIKYFPMAPVNMAWHSPISQVLPPTFPPSIGFLLPASEGLPVTGVIADTYSYPERQPPNTTVLTVMLGGTHFYKHFPTDLHHQPKSEQRQQLVKYAVDFLHEHRIISRAPDIIDTGVQMYPYAVPQYHCGHRQTLDTIHQCLLQQFNGRLSVTAASYLGIGMPDCMMNAWRLADKVCESVSSTTTMTSSLPKATITGLE